MNEHDKADPALTLCDDCGRVIFPQTEDAYPTIFGTLRCRSCWLKTVVGPAVEEARVS